MSPWPVTNVVALCSSTDSTNVWSLFDTLSPDAFPLEPPAWAMGVDWTLCLTGVLCWCFVLGTPWGGAKAWSVVKLAKSAPTRLRRLVATRPAAGFSSSSMGGRETELLVLSFPLPFVYVAVFSVVFICKLRFWLLGSLNVIVPLVLSQVALTGGLLP